MRGWVPRGIWTRTHRERRRICIMDPEKEVLMRRDERKDGRSISMILDLNYQVPPMKHQPARISITQYTKCFT